MPILICHANGFCAESYAYYVRRLAPGRRVLALDFSGHGHSAATLDFGNWDFFRDQALALIDHARLEQVIGMGHSLGGASLFRAAAAAPERFASVIGLDPVLLSGPMVLFMKVLGNPLAGSARGRRERFRSRRLVERAFRNFPQFADWPAETFEDFVNGCFIPDGDELRLACPRDVEGRIFNQSDWGSLRAYSKLKTEAHILIPEDYQVCPPRTAHKIARNNPRSTVQVWRGVNHMFPFERPEETLERVRALL